jgi:hypothetical protein
MNTTHTEAADKLRSIIHTLSAEAAEEQEAQADWQEYIGWLLATGQHEAYRWAAAR